LCNYHFLVFDAAKAQSPFMSAFFGAKFSSRRKSLERLLALLALAGAIFFGQLGNAAALGTIFSGSGEFFERYLSTSVPAILSLLGVGKK
jgi:hypothetical protein